MQPSAPALAGATAPALTRSDDGQSASDSDTVAAGPATAGVSGGHGGTLYSHSFNVNASANGDSGTIRVATGDGTVGNTSQASSSADGQIFDTLTFSGAGIGTVELSMTVLGSFRNTGGPSSLSFDSFVQIVNVTSTIRATGGWQDVFGSSVRYGGSVVTLEQGEVIFPGNPNSPSNVSATVRARASGPAQTFAIRAGLRVNSQNAPDSVSNAAFDQTARLSLSMPEGWTYTSESGSFLTVTETSPVPEMSSAVLVVLGGSGLWFGLRRRRVPPTAALPT